MKQCKHEHTYGIDREGKMMDIICIDCGKKIKEEWQGTSEELIKYKKKKENERKINKK